MREHSQDDELERRYAGTCLARPATRDRYPVPLDALASPVVRCLVAAIDAARRGRTRVAPGHVLASLETEGTPAERAKARQMVEAGLPIEHDGSAVHALTEALRQRGACRQLGAHADEVLQASRGGDWRTAQDALARAVSVQTDGMETDPCVTASDLWAESLARKEPREYIPVDERLDPLLRLEPGTLTVLGADPNVGKSTLATQWVDRAQTCGTPAGILTLEDPASLYAEKLAMCAAHRAGEHLDTSAMARGTLSAEERARAAHIFERVRAKTGAVRIVDVRDRSLERTVAGMRALAAYGCRLVVVDYLTAMRGDRRLGTQRERTDYNLNELQAAARTCGVAMVLCSQLTRPKDKMQRRPSLYDFKESGSIEQAAQYALALWRDEIIDDAPIKGVLLKNKTGRGLGREWQWKRNDSGYMVDDGEPPPYVPEAAGARARGRMGQSW